MCQESMVQNVVEVRCINARSYRVLLYELAPARRGMIWRIRGIRRDHLWVDRDELKLTMAADILELASGRAQGEDICLAFVDERIGREKSLIWSLPVSAVHWWLEEHARQRGEVLL